MRGNAERALEWFARAFENGESWADSWIGDSMLVSLFAGQSLDHLLLECQRIGSGHVPLRSFCRPTGVRLHFGFTDPINQEKSGRRQQP